MKNLAFIAVSLALITGACSSTPESAPRPSTAAPAITAAPTTAASATTPAPATPTTSAATTEPPPSSTRFDYASVGTEAGVTPTPLGRISWRSSGSVPGEWILDGFPSPEGHTLPPGSALTEREYADVEDSAPCCLITQPVGSGVVGLGSTGWRDPNEAEYPSNWREARLLGGSCEETPWRGHADEIWFATDEASWELLAQGVFGPDGLDMCHISIHIAERNGTWLIIAAWPGDNAAPQKDLIALISTDLVTWNEIPLGLNRPGMQTEIISVTTSNRGWAIFGSRVSNEPASQSESGIALGPHSVEWADWTSADGAAYEPLDLTSLIGPPWCEPREPHSCAAIHAYLMPDALVAYVHQYGADGEDHLSSGWRLWIGTFED